MIIRLSPGGDGGQNKSPASWMNTTEKSIFHLAGVPVAGKRRSSVPIVQWACQGLSGKADRAGLDEQMNKQYKYSTLVPVTEADRF